MFDCCRSYKCMSLYIKNLRCEKTEESAFRTNFSWLLFCFTSEWLSDFSSDRFICDSQFFNDTIEKYWYRCIYLNFRNIFTGHFKMIIHWLKINNSIFFCVNHFAECISGTWFSHELIFSSISIYMLSYKTYFLHYWMYLYGPDPPH